MSFSPRYIKPSDSMQAKLLSLPETGMGYQVFSGISNIDPYNHLFIAFNAQLIIPLSNVAVDKRLFSIRGMKFILENAAVSSFIDVQIVLKHQMKQVNDTPISYSPTVSSKTGATHNDPVQANGSDRFVRLSAYENDLRVNLQLKCLIPGSYTTTYADYAECKKTGADPIDRYALPTEEQIKHVFHVQPSSVDWFRPGIVEPANGHKGGGAEALFDVGTSPGTYLNRTDY
jgi:hypothetical protein